MQNYLDYDIFDADMNLRTIVIIDKSTYLEKYPESPMLEVLPPGHTKWVSLPFKTRDTNTITSSQLNLTCGEVDTLPDGVYRFRLSVCPNDKVFLCKNYLRTTILDYGIQDLILKIIGDCCPESKKLKKALVEIDILRNGAKAEVALGNVSRGASMYQKAVDLLNKTNKTC